MFIIRLITADGATVNAEDWPQYRPLDHVHMNALSRDERLAPIVFVSDLLAGAVGEERELAQIHPFASISISNTLEVHF